MSGSPILTSLIPLDFLSPCILVPDLSLWKVQLCMIPFKMWKYGTALSLNYETLVDDFNQHHEGDVHKCDTKEKDGK